MRKIILLFAIAIAATCAFAQAPAAWISPTSTRFGFQLNGSSSNVQFSTLWNWGSFSNGAVVGTLGGPFNGLIANNTSSCSASGTPAGCYKAFTGIPTDPGNTNAQTRLADPSPTNISTNKIDEYLYPGSVAEKPCELQPWWDHGMFGHPDIGQDLSSTALISAKLQAMKNAGCTIAWIDYYNSSVDSGFDDATTARYAAQVASFGMKLWILYDQGSFKGPCPQNPATWNPATAYTVGQGATYMGVAYVSIQNGTNHQPDVSPTFWQPERDCIANAINADLDNLNSLYFGQSYYWNLGGKPMVSFFVTETNWPNVDWTSGSGVWALVRSHTNGYGAGGIKMIFRFGSFSHVQSDGEYAWIQPDIYSNSSPNTQLCWDEIDGDSTCNPATGLRTGGTSYLATFYAAARANPSQYAIGAMWARFDWSQSGYTNGIQKLTAGLCGKLPALTAAKMIAAGYSASSPITAMALVTWDDYGEGTAFEPGLDPCLNVSSSIATDTVTWSIVKTDTTYADPNTVLDHIEVVGMSPTGQSFTPAGNLPITTTSLNIKNLFPAGPWTIFVRAVGRAMIQNRISTGISYTSTSTTAGQPNIPLIVSSITITGANASDFSQTNNCVAPLNHNQICEIGVTFSPAAGGIKSATLNVFDNAPGSPHTVPLSGTGFAVTGTLYTISPNGDDSHNCTTQACLTWNKLLNGGAITGGDELQANTGTYYLPTIQSGVPITITKSGTSTSPILITAAPGANVIVTDLLKINSTTTGCSPSVGCMTVTWVNDANDSNFPNCTTTGATPCTVWKAAVTGLVPFETFFYLQAGVGHNITRRPRPAVNNKNAIPPTQSADTTMCVPNQTSCTGGTNAQQCANIACGFPAAGLNGVNPAGQINYCPNSRPWYCGFAKFEYHTGDLTTGMHSMNIGDVEILNFAFWTMERMRLGSVVPGVSGAPNVATTTGASVTSGNSGFTDGHEYEVENNRPDMGPGDAYLDRCPNGCPGNVPEATQTIYVAANNALGEDPTADTLMVPQMPGPNALSGCGAATLLTATGVSNIVFGGGITFQGGDWCPTQYGLPDLQGIPSVPDTVHFQDSSNITWAAPDQTHIGMQVLHTTGWAFGLHGNSQNWYIDSGSFTDCGAGCVKVGDIGSNSDICHGGSQNVPSGIIETNNAIIDGGRVQPSGEATCNYWGNNRDSVSQHNTIGGCYGGAQNFGHMLNVGAFGNAQASCFAHNFSLWNEMFGEGFMDQFIGLLTDIGGQYGATNDALDCGDPLADPGLNPANFCNETGYNKIHDIATNYNLLGVAHGSAGLYFDQGATKNIAHHNVVFRTTQDGVFNNLPSHCASTNPNCNAAAEGLPQANLYINNILALNGSSTLSGSSWLSSPINRVLHRGGPSGYSFHFISNVGYFNSANNGHPTNPHGHWEPYLFTQLPVVDGGSAYIPSSSFPVTFTGGSCTIEPQGEATTDTTGAVASFMLTVSGSNCTTMPTPDYTAGGGMGAIVSMTLSGGQIALGSPVLAASVWQLWKEEKNDFFDAAGAPMPKAICTDSACAGAYQVFYPNLWGNDQSEGVGDVNVDPGFPDPTYPADDFRVTADLSVIGFADWNHNLAGRTNTLLGYNTAPNTFVHKVVSAITDYTCIQYSGTTCVKSLTGNRLTVANFGGGTTAPLAPPPPAGVKIASACPTSANQGVAFSFVPQTKGGIPPFMWSIPIGALPNGLAQNLTSGAITGTPSAAGAFAFTQAVMDSAETGDSQACTITVNAGPSITSPPPPNGVKGTAYPSYTSTATGGTAPYTWSISAGSLPPGLSQNGSTGAISGTPTTVGTFAFTIKATDAGSLTATQAVTVQITASNACGWPNYNCTTRSNSVIPNPAPLFSAADAVNSVKCDTSLNPCGVNPITRATDATTASNQSCLVTPNGGFNDNLWASDHSKLFIRCVNGNSSTNYVLGVNTTTLQVTGKSSAISNAISAWWSLTDPNVLWSVSNAGKIYKNVFTPGTLTFSQTLFYDLLASCTPLIGQSIASAGPISVDSTDANFEVILTSSGQQSTGFAAAYNATRNACSVLDSSSGNVTLENGSVVASTMPCFPIGMHAGFTLKNGTWGAFSTATIGSCPNRQHFWQFNTATVLTCTPGGSVPCGNHDFPGYNIYVDSPTVTGQGGFPQFYYKNPVTGPIPPPIGQFYLTSPNQDDEHFVWTGTGAGIDTSPIIGEFVKQAWTGSAFTQPAENEIFGILRGTPGVPNTGTLVRFAHHFASTGTTCTGCDFRDTNAIGSASPDGYVLAFTSDMLLNLGTDAAGKPAQHIFLIRLD